MHAVLERMVWKFNHYLTILIGIDHLRIKKEY